MSPHAPIIPDAEFAEFARAFITEFHDDWDALHAFETLHWTDGSLSVGLHAAIDTSYEPRDYPKIMLAMASETIDRCETEKMLPAPCGYLLQIETYYVETPDDANEAFKAQLVQDHRDGSISTRPDTIEAAWAMVTDLRGNIWEAVKRRDTGEIREGFYPLHLPGGSQGRMVRALRTIGLTTGHRCWGMPDPTITLN